MIEILYAEKTLRVLGFELGSPDLSYLALDNKTILSASVGTLACQLGKSRGSLTQGTLNS